ncbi:MAG: HAMP domain-containing histidine kinase [Actinomycetota bacterium]|nr:HAMP domain-containing histidine kinase [Actinomycetota bacterium]
MSARVLRRLSLRTKLTLIFLSAMALLLAAIGSFLFFRTKANLDEAIRQSLRVRAGQLAQAARAGSAADARSLLIGPGERFAQILTRSGRVLDARPQNAPPLLSPAEARGARTPRFIERGERARLLVLPLRAHGRSLLAVVAASLTDREHALEGLGRALLIGGPLALLFASLLAYGVATAALRPVERMRRRAAEITVADPAARLPVPDSEDEIHRLSTTLNEMLSRLARSAEHQRAFVANASHELRTPLAAMRLELELTLKTATTLEEFRRATARAMADADELARLAEDLLVLAGAEGASLRLRDVDVRALLTGAAREVEPQAQQTRRRVLAQPGDVAGIRADPDRLRQALRNMAHNALIHGHGDITLGAETNGTSVRLWVADDGPPVPDTVLDIAFARFARGAGSQSRPGAGLGLPIVREIARAHGGDAFLTNTPNGVVCAIELPCVGSSSGQRAP